MPCSGIAPGWPSASPSLVGTTVKDPPKVPRDLVADEKLTRVAQQQV
jgi:hypothetical protein